MIDINSKLSGRYIITQTIGSGGMANVYLARDLILDRDVAVKVLKFDFQDNQDAIRRFQREAMAASQLLHHNIIEVYDVDEEDGQQYIVMEYVQGMDLKTFIRQKSPISLEVVVNVMSQILSAITVAHRHGIIHRDIKPQNILITKNNEVKITDFGIAIALTDTSLTQTNTLLGSVHYLSPEQARGGNANIKSDIYALGVVLYELITGEVPFDGESAVSIALKHFQEKFPMIRDHIDYVPQSLENVVLHATAKSLDARYNSTQEMLMDLSTSLSINRMHERRFNPEEKAMTLDTIITPIKPLGTADRTLATVEEEPNGDSEEVQTYDTIAPITQPKRKRGLILKILGALLTIIVIAGLYLAVNHSLRTTTVPELENLSQEEAIALLEEHELAVGEIQHQWHEQIQLGHVISSSPGENETVDKQSSVNLIISSGREQVEIGNYVGQSYETVRRLLINTGFIVDRHDMYTNNPEEAGVILAQSIDPGSQVVPMGSAMTLTVGSYSESGIMQDFYNMPLNMVENFVDNYGLNLEYDYEYSTFIPVDQVVSQSPASGTPLYPGDTISVTLSMGPEEDEVLSTTVPVYLEYVPTYAPSDTNQERPLPNKIQVFIGDENNDINQIAEEFEITESRTIQITLFISTQGVGQYRVLRDGEIYEESNSVYPE